MKYWQLLYSYFKMHDWIFIKYCPCSISTSNGQHGAYTWSALSPGEELDILGDKHVPQYVTW
jgi:hypothetical protein